MSGRVGRAGEWEFGVLEGVGRDGGDFLPAGDICWIFAEGAGVILIGAVVCELVGEESERDFSKIIVRLVDELMNGGFERV